MSFGTATFVCAALGALILMPLLPSRPRETNSTASASADSPSAKFAALSDEFMKESLALSPTTASSAGYHKHTDQKTGKTIDLDAQLDEMSLQMMAEARAF